jgi:hypothetical protein
MMTNIEVLQGAYYKHLESNTIYRVICLATHVDGMTPSVVYGLPNKEEAWVMSRAKFVDGRFALWDSASRERFVRKHA